MRGKTNKIRRSHDKGSHEIQEGTSSKHTLQNVSTILNAGPSQRQTGTPLEKNEKSTELADVGIRSGRQQPEISEVILRLQSTSIVGADTLY
nr:hypothetical transcript [Hymenolepis microstoma]